MSKPPQAFRLGLSKAKVYQKTNKGYNLLVSDILDVETLKCLLSLRHFRGSVKSSDLVRSSQPQCEAKISFREEVGFKSNPIIFDTHNSIMEGIS
jgi:hypothetical protein